MACFVPFNNRNLEICFFVFRPTVVIVDELVAALKRFSSWTESLGCVHSAIFKSIHGNMIVWYGAWMKRSNEKKQLLSESLLSMLMNVTSMAILIDHSFFDAYHGESRDGSPAAKFFTGDIVSMNATTLSPEKSKDNDNISYANLALFKDRFRKMEGATAGVCLRSQDMPQIVGLIMWKSLQSFYTYILNSDIRRTVLPYLDNLNPEVKYDIFKVVYVSGDGVQSVQLHPQHRVLEKDVKNNGASPAAHNS